MLFFEVPKEKVKDLVRKFANSYNLLEDIIVHVVKNIDEYTNVINTKILNENIEDSIPLISSNLIKNMVCYLFI